MTGKMKDEISDMIRTHGSVTFAEMEDIPGFKGDICQVLVNKKLNFEILLWPRMSQEASVALDELLTEKVIAASTCNVLAYFADGQVPQVELLPASIKSRTKPFASRKIYWQPLQFNVFGRVRDVDRIPLRLCVSPAGGAAT